MTLRFILVCTIAWALGAATEAQEHPADPKEALESARPERWRHELSTAQHSVEDVVRILLEVALDKTRDGDTRIEAILLAGTTNSETVRRFCLEHVSLRITKSLFRADDDELKQMPCVYVLKRQGWAAVGSILARLRTNLLSPEHVREIGAILARTCTADAAVAVLRATAATQGGEVARTNVEKLVEELTR